MLMIKICTRLLLERRPRAPDGGLLETLWLALVIVLERALDDIFVTQLDILLIFE